MPGGGAGGAGSDAGWLSWVLGGFCCCWLCWLAVGRAKGVVWQLLFPDHPLVFCWSYVCPGLMWHCRMAEWQNGRVLCLAKFDCIFGSMSTVPGGEMWGAP